MSGLNTGIDASATWWWRCRRQWLAPLGAVWYTTSCIDVRTVEERSGGAPDRGDASVVVRDAAARDASVTAGDSQSSIDASSSGATAPSGASEVPRSDAGDGLGGRDASVEEPSLELRLGPASNTPLGGAAAGVNGPPLEETLCPFDEVLTGLKIRANTNSLSTRYQAPTSIAAVCSSAQLRPGSGGWELELTETRALRWRGAGLPDDLETHLLCPEGRVVVGFGGLEGTYSGPEEGVLVEYVDGIHLICGELTLDDSSPKVGTGEPTLEIGKPLSDAGLPFDYECGSGEMARGIAVAAGSWIDSVGIVCASARTTGSAGSSCAMPDQCSSMECLDGRCSDAWCPSNECDCALYAETPFALCPFANWSGAEAACAASGMTLASITDSSENAWLRATADALGFGDLWIGGTDAVDEGIWQWAEGGVFWDNGLPVNGSFAWWASSEPNASQETMDCAQLRGEDGFWTAKDCVQRASFACRR